MKFSPEAAFFDHCAERKMEKSFALKRKTFQRIAEG